MAHALRILHLSTVDIEGGAARSAYRLHVGLRQLGYESLMLVAEKKSYDPSVIAFAPPTGILNRLTRRLRHDRITGAFLDITFLAPRDTKDLAMIAASTGKSGQQLTSL